MYLVVGDIPADTVVLDIQKFSCVLCTLGELSQTSLLTILSQPLGSRLAEVL